MKKKEFDVAIWAYPWDQMGIGVHAFLDAVEAAGITAVSMATSYHTGLFLTPHHPQHRLYFPEDGVLYFRPTKSKLKGLQLKPLLSKTLQDEEPLRELIEQAQKRNIKIRSWFVCTHNTALGRQNPDVVLRNAYGDPLYFGLCPSNPKVVDYLTTLLADLAATHDIDAIDLESLGFLGLPHDYHHEKDLVGLDSLSNLLLSLCFCESCMTQASQAGLDAKRVKNLVKDELEKFFSGDLAESDNYQFSTLFSDPEFQAYLNFRMQSVMDLAHQVRESVHKGCRLQLIEWSTPDQWWQGGFDPGIGELVDGMIMCAYNRDTSYLQKLVQETQRALPDTTVLGGIQGGFPTCSSPEDLKKQLDAVKTSGAAGVQVYHFGLMRQRNLHWLGQALDA